MAFTNRHASGPAQHPRPRRPGEAVYWLTLMALGVFWTMAAHAGETTTPSWSQTLTDQYAPPPPKTTSLPERKVIRARVVVPLPADAPPAPRLSEVLRKNATAVATPDNGGFQAMAPPAGLAPPTAVRMEPEPLRKRDEPGPGRVMVMDFAPPPLSADWRSGDFVSDAARPERALSTPPETKTPEAEVTAGALPAVSTRKPEAPRRNWPPPELLERLVDPSR